MKHHLTEEQHACWRRIGFVSPDCPCPADPECDCSVACAVWPDEAGTGVAALLEWAADEGEPFDG